MRQETIWTDNMPFQALDIVQPCSKGVVKVVAEDVETIVPSLKLR